MTSIDTESLLTIIYVLVDDWYKSEGHQLLLAGLVGFGLSPYMIQRTVATAKPIESCDVGS